MLEKVSASLKLVCFDFDALMNINLHDELEKEGFVPVTYGNVLVGKESTDNSFSIMDNKDYDPEKVQEFTRKILNDPKKGLRYPQELEDVFKLILKQGHKIAITAVNQYPDALPIVLEKLDLSFIERPNVYIVSGFSNLGRKDFRGKTSHIELAKEWSNIKNNADILLVDSDEGSIKAANKQHIKTVQVDKNFSWMLVQHEILKIQKENKVMNEKMNRMEENAITSELQLLNVFINKSIGLYANQKAIQHTDNTYNDTTMKKDVKDNLISLLEGLKEDAKSSTSDKKNEILCKAMANLLKNNLDDYIDTMDKEITANRDQILLEENKEPDSVELDEALMKAAAKSSFTAFGKVIKKMENNPKDQDKTTIWSKAADFFKKIKITPIADFCDKQHAKIEVQSIMAKVSNTNNQLQQNIEEIKKNYGNNTLAGPTPTPRNPNKSPTQQLRKG